MQKYILILLLGIFTMSIYGQSEEPAIIPKPVSMDLKQGEFTLPDEVLVYAPKSEELKEAVHHFTEKLEKTTGKKVTTANKASKATIAIQLNKKSDKELGDEGYELVVEDKKIELKANKPAGVFYGIQTLLQLFPVEIESAEKVENIAWKVPALAIKDYPRFGWRGLMFDVSRHFFTVDEVKQFIDQMVKYKYNLLHLHLTDDQGWRIEIKEYPKLTEVGAWAVKKEGYYGTFSEPDADEERDYGGFFTQDDIKEIIAYAKDNFVDILPEVDVPGHSLAALAAYPELSCTDEEADKFKVISGEPFMDWSQGAPPIALIDNNLCPYKENVYEFIDKVVAEIAALFPFEYIHMGGDEAAHNYWEKDPKVKELMKKENLKTIEEVQSYFTKRVEKIVASKGKKMIGWDEIIEGGLPKNAAVMSWRGLDGGIEAAKAGHEVVMSPTTYAYIDYMQGDPFMEPKVYASLYLSKAYEFEALPDGVDPKWIKGGQANLWTEQIYNMRTVEYMVWPRGMAISEALWSPKEHRNWEDFSGRVETHFTRFDQAEVKYAPSIYEPKFEVTADDQENLKIKLNMEITGVDLHYSFDNSFPDKFYPVYESALEVPVDAANFRVVGYKDGKQVGRMITVPREKLNERAGITRDSE